MTRSAPHNIDAIKKQLMRQNLIEFSSIVSRRPLRQLMRMGTKTIVERESPSVLRIPDRNESSHEAAVIRLLRRSNGSQIWAKRRNKLSRKITGYPMHPHLLPLLRNTISVIHQNNFYDCLLSTPIAASEQWERNSNKTAAAAGKEQNTRKINKSTLSYENVIMREEKRISTN